MRHCKLPLCKRVIVLERTQSNIRIIEGRDVLWNDEMKKVNADCPPESWTARTCFSFLHKRLDGQPKGVVHTCGGYMVYADYTFQNVFQYQAGVFWCTADIGWVTGHSYIVYGPLLAGATTLMLKEFRRIPMPEDSGRWWINTKSYFYTAPTAIRALEHKDWIRKAI